MSQAATAAALCAAAFISMHGTGAAVSALPYRLQLLSGSSASAAWLASAFAVSYVLLQRPAGRMADRIGFRPLLISGFLLMAVSGLFFEFASLPLVIFMGRFIQGAGEAPIWASAPALLTRLYPSASGRMVGLYGACFQFGLTSGPLTGMMSANHPDAISPFTIYGVSALVCALTVGVFVREPVHETETDQPRKNTQARPRTNVAGKALLFTAVPAGGGYGLIVSCIPAFLLDSGTLAAGTIGLFFMVSYSAFGAAQFAAGALSDFMGRSGLVILGAVLAGAGIGLFPVLSGAQTLVALGIGSAGLGAVCSASLAALCDTVGLEHRGQASGEFYLFWGAGYFLLPLAAQEFGMLTGGILFGITLTAGAVCVSLAARRTRPRPRPRQ